MIKVILKREMDKYKNSIYVGRGSVLGNPYTHHQDRETKAHFIVSSREESIELYKKYLIEKIEQKDESICSELNRIYTIAKKEDVHLACYCKPKSCHADVIKEMVESKIKKEPQQGGAQLSMFDDFNKD
jgi:hypothetical protein